jgi:hypothetical protein
MITITVPSLNVGETLQVSGLVNDAANLPTKVDVTVRGKGVNGEPKRPTKWER